MIIKRCLSFMLKSEQLHISMSSVSRVVYLFHYSYTDFIEIVVFWWDHNSHLQWKSIMPTTHIPSGNTSCSQLTSPVEVHHVHNSHLQWKYIMLPTHLPSGNTSCSQLTLSVEIHHAHNSHLQWKYIMLTTHIPSGSPSCSQLTSPVGIHHAHNSRLQW